MKQPIENDFDIENHDAGVDLTFRPTEGQYSFVLLDPMIAGPEGGPSSDMQRFED